MNAIWIFNIIPKYLKFPTLSKDLSCHYVVILSCILLTRHGHILIKNADFLGQNITLLFNKSAKCFGYW